MRENYIGAIVLKSIALFVVVGMAYQTMAQDAATPYSKMAPIAQYLMDRAAEITLARSAAPDSLPDLESGAMDYMMSKSSYLTDEGAHNMPHLMFDTLVKDGKDWGSGAEGSPVMSSPYWFFYPDQQPQMKGLPPILVFLVGVANWSDGTPAGMHSH